MTEPKPDPAPPPREETGVAPPAVKAEGWAHALDGSDGGSDTRAGSLQGGSATGSERDEAQIASDRHLAALGPELRAAEHPAEAPPAQPNIGVTNTGAPREQARAPGDQADPATS